jgi:hypothetical protein
MEAPRGNILSKSGVEVILASRDLEVMLFDGTFCCSRATPWPGRAETIVATPAQRARDSDENLIVQTKREKPYVNSDTRPRKATGRREASYLIYEATIYAATQKPSTC